MNGASGRFVEFCCLRPTRSSVMISLTERSLVTSGKPRVPVWEAPNQRLRFRWGCQPLQRAETNLLESFRP